MFGYATAIRSLSKGRAVYSMEPLRFEQVPKERARHDSGSGRQEAGGADVKNIFKSRSRNESSGFFVL